MSYFSIFRSTNLPAPAGSYSVWRKPAIGITGFQPAVEINLQSRGDMGAITFELRELRRDELTQVKLCYDGLEMKIGRSQEAELASWISQYFKARLARAAHGELPSSAR